MVALFYTVHEHHASMFRAKISNIIDTFLLVVGTLVIG